MMDTVICLLSDDEGTDKPNNINLKVDPPANDSEEEDLARIFKKYNCNTDYLEKNHCVPNAAIKQDVDNIEKVNISTNLVNKPKGRKRKSDGATKLLEKREEQEKQNLEIAHTKENAALKQAVNNIEKVNISTNSDTISEIDTGIKLNGRKRKSDGVTKLLEKKQQEDAKLLKKQEREKQKLELAQSKENRKALQAAYKNLKPEESLKVYVVLIDSNIISSMCGTEIPNALQTAGIAFRLVEQIHPFTITVSTQVQQQLINVNGELDMIQNTNSKELIYILMWNDIVPLVHNNALTKTIDSIKNLLVDKKIYLGIFGIESYFRSKHTRKKSKDPKVESLPLITRKDLDLSLIELQILYGISHHMLESALDVSNMVLSFAKSVAQAPYKLQKQLQQQETDWYVSGDNKDCVRVDKHGNGLLRLWSQQLTQFSMARLETAEAICSLYPSPHSLMQEYNRVTIEKGEKLLQDIQIRRAAGPLTSVRKVGPELSKKIYTLFTSEDGEMFL